MRSREQALVGHYDNLVYQSPPLDQWGYERLCRSVGTTPKSPLLDVGCGDGRLHAQVPDLDWTGVDYNQIRAEAAGGIHADLYEWLDSQTTRRWVQAAAIEVLEHLEDPVGAVERIRRVADEVVATVPINMPYVAHIQVWKTAEEAIAFFSPKRHARGPGRHLILYW